MLHLRSRRSYTSTAPSPRRVHTRSRSSRNMLLWLVEDLSQKLDGLLENLPRLCKQLAQLRRDFIPLAKRILSSVPLWDGLQEIGHSPWVLQTLIDLWIPFMDLDLDRLHSPLISLQGCLKRPDDEKDSVWALWAMTQAQRWLNQTNVGLLLSRFREVQEMLLHVPYDPKEWEVVPCDGSSFRLPDDGLVGHVLAHLSSVLEVLLSLTEPDLLQSLFDLEEIWTVLQNRQCWTFMENELC